MEQYISKDAIVAEIERMLEAIASSSNENNRELAAIIGAQQYELINLSLFINNLEVKEVDLEKEYDNEFFKDPVFGKLVNRNAGISIAKHSFELGLKAQKGE